MALLWLITARLVDVIYWVRRLLIVTTKQQATAFVRSFMLGHIVIVAKMATATLKINARLVIVVRKALFLMFAIQFLDSVSASRAYLENIAINAEKATTNFQVVAVHIAVATISALSKAIVMFKLDSVNASQTSLEESVHDVKRDILI